jgi:TRAP-type C4-dicarboxylate transport system permease small subunit
MNAILRSAAAIDRTLARIIRAVVVGAMIGILVLVSIAILSRRTTLPPLVGWDEVVELLFAWMVFLGALAHWRAGTLFRVSLLHDLARGPWLRALRVAVALLMLVFALTLTVWGWEFAFDTIQMTPVLSLPKNAWFAALPVAGAGMTVYGLIQLWRALRGAAPEGATGRSDL